MSANNVISLNKVTEVLTDAGVSFASVSEEYLAQGYCRIFQYASVGIDIDSSKLETLGKYEGVQICGQTYSLQIISILHMDIHTHRRIGLFNRTSRYGLQEISVEDGIENVREFVESGSEPAPEPVNTLDSENLIQELVDAGAVAIAIEPILSDEDRLMFKVWMPPATGYDLVGSYGEVKIRGEVFDLDWEFVCHSGPRFLNQVPVYLEDNSLGMNSVAITDGISNLESYVADGCPRSVGAYPMRGESNEWF